MTETPNDRPPPGEAAPARGCPVCRAAADWWPLLVPPAVMAGVYAVEAAGLGVLASKPVHEVIALVLLSAATGVAGLRWLRRRRPEHGVLTVVCAVFLLREVHVPVPGWKEGFYVAVGLIGLWCVGWRRRLWPVVVGQTRGRWLVATTWAYLLALLVQRRALKFLPHEADIHIQLEEVGENLAHLFLLILGLL